MNWRNFKLVVISLFIIALYGCNSGNNSNSSNVKDTTVLVYVMGSDLETDGNYATTNIEQMKKIGSTANMNVVIETGGAKKEGWQRIKRYQVLKDNTLLKQDLGSQNMALGSSLTDFINWGVKNYPAKKYVLVFWDHAGGPNGGYGRDENQPEEVAVMSLPTLISAVKASKTYFEIIGFDTCLMGSLEVAAGLAPYTRYFVGSEDLEPGKGWDYTRFLQFVTSNPNANGIDIGKNIVNGFIDYNAGDATTLSVIDSKTLVNELIPSFNSFAQNLNSYLNNPTFWKTIARARLKSFDFDTNIVSGPYTDLVDLKSWISHLQNTNIFKNDSNLMNSANAVLNAYDKTILYSKASQFRAQATGLTIYYPSALSQYSRAYYTDNTKNNLFYNSSYTNLVQAYWQYYSDNTSLLSASINNIQDSATQITANITNDFIQAYALGNGQDDCNLGNNIVTKCFTSMQSIYNTTNNEYDVVYNKNDVMATSWPTITDSTNNISNIIMIPDSIIDPEAILQINNYLVPVAKIDNDNKIENGFISLLRNKDGTFMILSFQDNQNNTSISKTEPIKSGDKFYMNTYAFDGEKNEWKFMPNKAKIFTAPLVFATNGTISKGSNFALLVTDLTGNTIMSDQIIYSIYK